mmetsp:Transcript_27806/g.70882  ORF Transcript_27806/g.70882 Transcript_27806/m.70882 type:complete len:80 (-) Transcript_27806:168-407(-)
MVKASGDPAVASVMLLLSSASVEYTLAPNCVALHPICNDNTSNSRYNQLICKCVVAIFASGWVSKKGKIQCSLLASTSK